MRRTARLSGIVFVFCIILLNGLSTDAMAAKAEQDKVAVAELTAMLHDFLANSSTADAHARFWADELVYTSSNGTRFGKADIMQGFAEPDAGDSAESPVVYSGEDVSVQVFGTTAVVTFRLVGTPADGSATSQYFNTGTFLKRHGEWRVIAWQATVIPASSEVNPD